MKRLLLLLLAFLPALSGAEVLPSTPNGQLVRQYLDAFNGGETTMRAFLEKTPSPRPIEERLERYRQMKSDLGSLTPVRLLGDSSGSVQVVVRAGNGREFALTVMIAGEKPQIAGLRIEPVEDSAPPKPAGPPEEEAAVLRQIQDLTAEKAKAGQFSGTVLIGRGPEIVWQGAYGFADESSHTANQADTRFDVGSIVKSFTMVAIGQLLEQDKLKLTDKVGLYLPDYPNATVRKQVTISQLLNMSSGIGDFFGEKFQQAPKEGIRTLRDYLPFFASDPLQFQPGAQRKYSNGGYLVLGLIIEKITGQSYYDYVQKNIFDRAGMKNSSFGLRHSGDPKQAIGYTTITASGEESPGGKRYPNLALLPARGSSAGSAQCTAGDLLSYAQALAAGKLISAATIEKLDLHPDGMGIAGGAPGLNATLDTGVEAAGSARYRVAVMSNFDPPSAEQLSREIRTLLRRVK
jgi:CubicO group peptidase (beta-lactamase class C family)